MHAPIQHDGEPNGNSLRKSLAASTGRGQRTYTPTLAAIAKAKGCRLWTVDGRELIDFASGVLVTNLGHAHARFEERYAHYCKDLPRSSYNFLTAIEVEAAERLLCSTGLAKMERVLWAASGSEAIQKALWAALDRDPERRIILGSRHGFHGKKGLAGEVSGESSPNPNVRFFAMPMDEDWPQSRYEDELAALGAEWGNQLAAVITEPYLGAAGSWHPPAWYHPMVQRFCEEHGAALIWDEVQSCHGRTGHMYAFQGHGVEPDLLVLGKGVANGEPCAAVLGRGAYIDALDYGEASDTFSGNPRACAAVCAVLDVFEEDGIVDQCRQVAPYCREKLEELAAAFPFLTAVRGEGLVFGLECESPEAARACVLEAYRGDGAKGVHFLGPLARQVLRVSPPLVITRAELDEAFALLHAAFGRVEAVHAS